MAKVPLELQNFSKQAETKSVNLQPLGFFGLPRMQAQERCSTTGNPNSNKKRVEPQSLLATKKKNLKASKLLVKKENKKNTENS